MMVSSLLLRVSSYMDTTNLLSAGAEQLVLNNELQDLRWQQGLPRRVVALELCHHFASENREIRMVTIVGRLYVMVFQKNSLRKNETAALLLYFSRHHCS